MKDEMMWNLETEREQMWADDPERAARLAYIELLKIWDQQVSTGKYRGIPAVHRRSAQLRGRPVRQQPQQEVVPDSDAGMWVVPGKLRAAWDDAA